MENDKLYSLFDYKELFSKYVDCMDFVDFPSYITADNMYEILDSGYKAVKEKNMEKEIEQNELFHRCQCCGELITNENKSDLDENLCSKCAANYTKCNDCGKVIKISESYRTANGHDICEDCRLESYVYCNDCGDLIPLDDAYHIADIDEYICEHCYENGDYSCCDNCGNYITSVGINVVGDMNLCDECARKDSVIMEYSTKVQNIDEINMFQKTREDKPDTKLFYGIELEVLANDDTLESAKHTMNLLGKENIIIKHDGSLSSNGYEIVTAPMTYNRHHEFWRKFFEEERNGKHYGKGLSSFNTECCGIHIHISRAALQLSDICKIVFFVNEETNKQFIAHIASRDSNSYCQIHKKSLEELQTIQRCGKLRYNDRYEAVNLDNNDTVEIRIFRGTVEQVSFFKNLEFVDCLIKFVRNKTFLQLSYDEFIKFLAKYKDRYSNLYNWMLAKESRYSKLLKECK